MELDSRRPHSYVGQMIQLRSLRPLIVPSLLVFFVSALGCDGNGDSSSSTAGSAGSGTGASGGSGGAGASGGSGATGGGGTGGATGGGGGQGGGDLTIGGDRPVKMYIPSSYDGSEPAPLIVLLHGYSASGGIQELYFGFKSIAEERGFIYAVPDGTEDATMKQFWNATDACCDFGGTGVDDSAYLSGVVEEIKSKYNVDPKRVYFVGHSNGGFMSYRMACDHADQIAAIVSLAGATFADDTLCTPSEPVAVLQIHGTMDETVLYDGGTFVVDYPGAVTSAETWAAHGGCEKAAADGGTLDIEGALAGDETTVSMYATGCQPGGHAELWTIAGGSHIPNLGPDFKVKVFDFLEAHPKP